MRLVGAQIAQMKDWDFESMRSTSRVATTVFEGNVCFYNNADAGTVGVWPP
jgi:hypothetical protein